MRVGKLGRGWLALLGLLVLVAAIVATVWLTEGSRRFAGTNSVAPVDTVATVPGGRRLCVRRLWMPPGADAVSMLLGNSRAAGTAVALSLSTPEGRRSARATVPSRPTRAVVFPVRPLRRGSPVTACLRPAGTLDYVGGTKTNPFLGVNYTPRPLPTRGPPQADVDGAPLKAGLVGVRFLAPGQHSAADELGAAGSRASLFRPGIVGSWTYVALLVVVPLLWILGLLLLLDPERRRRPVLIVAALAFVNAAAWSIITPPFEGPDEEAHVAYATHLAETGKSPKHDLRLPYASTEIRLAIEATHHFTVFRSPLETRPPWEARDQRGYERAVAERHAARDDGGGETGATNYGPAYYGVEAVGYRLAGGSLFNRIFVMRLLSALLAAITVAFVYAAVAELLPGRRWPAVAAALAVSFQPMFGFISGVVNPDAAANLAGAALLYLAIRAMRRGLTVGVAAALAAVFVVGAVAKTTVITLAPALLLAVVIAARRRRPARRVWLALGGTLAGVALVWVAIASLLGRTTAPQNTTQAALPDSAGVASQMVHLSDRLVYMWQVFFPPLPGMKDIYVGPDLVPAWTIYVKRAWGSFGWLTIEFPRVVYLAIALALLVVIGLAVRAALRERPAVRARTGEIAVLALAFVSVALSAHYGLARANPSGFVLEQGRYLFPAVIAAAVVGIAACYGLGRRRAQALALVLVTAMMLLSGLSQLFVFIKYYT